MEKNPAENLIWGHVKSETLLKQLAFNEKMAELGRMSAGVVHEINTPLSVIAAASQLILGEEGLSEFVVEMVERIHSEALRLSAVTRGVLSFARQDEGMESETDVNTVLGEVTSFLGYEAKKRSVKVVQDFDHRIPMMRLDPGPLKQVFINLIMNALQVMPEGGDLEIATRLSAQETTASVTVCDSGPGIAPDVIGRIFNPFFTTKGNEGTGLGLFVTRNIVEALRGEIKAENREEGGACFTLVLPLRMPEQPA
jgi:two-component system NtrC family sensor kinase